MKKISSNINFGSGNQDMDLKPLEIEINKFSSATDITAYLSEDKQAITLRSRQGFDILIEDFNLDNDDNRFSIRSSTALSSKANRTLPEEREGSSWRSKRSFIAATSL